jgi:hypothetical protein
LYEGFLCYDQLAVALQVKMFYRAYSLVAHSVDVHKKFTLEYSPLAMGNILERTTSHWLLFFIYKEKFRQNELVISRFPKATSICGKI